MPLKVGYHCSHEQFPPSRLLDLALRAEEAGFGAAMCSDHFAPFSSRQGQSGFAWSWLGAALARTSLTFGTVAAPGQRYPPAIVAQAAATLCEMFPGRFWLALGSGQFVNEHVTGEGWPPKERRNQRLRECAESIRRLLRGECVDFEGTVRVEHARLHTLPMQPPPLFVAAITPETAAWAAQWAEALITVFQSDGKMEEVIGAFRRERGRESTVFLQAQHAFAENEAQALEGAHDQWRQSVLPSSVLADLRTPEQIDAATENVPGDEVAGRVRVSAEPAQHVEWLREYEALGVDTVFVHQVTRDQEYFIDHFGRDVLPALRG